MSTSYADIIALQTRRAVSGEFKLWDKVDKFFLSEPWASTTTGESEAKLMKTSTNHVFPIVETASSMLLPPNPQVTFSARVRTDTEKLPLLEAYANACFDEGHLRQHLSLAIQAVVKYGRGPMKTVWDAKQRRFKARYVNPRSHFFDRSAMLYEDIRYEYETTILSKADLRRRVESGLYDKSVLEHARSNTYIPAHLRPTNTRATRDEVMNYRPWTIVHEFYDYDEGQVVHILDDCREPILREPLTRRPYRLLTFNHNGTDAGGVSEIGLILPNAEEFNWNETFLLNILRYGIPHEWYDARLSSEDEMVKAMTAPLGSMKGVKVPGGTALRDAFHQSQLPQYPPLAKDMMEGKRQGIANVSALSDAMRAQTIGAKTATEVAFLDGHTKNRLRPRSSSIDELVEGLAEDGIGLARRYLDEEVDVRVEKQGKVTFVYVNPNEIQDVLGKPKIVAYSPMEVNKAVRIETLRNMQPLFINNPLINQRRFMQSLLEDAEIDTGVLNTEEEMAMAAKALAGPAAKATPPSDEPPPEEPGGTDLPPRSAGMSAVVANPTDQPAP